MKQQITIKLDKGRSRTIDAAIYGEVAVHETQPPRRKDKGYTVSHVETGVAIVNDLKRLSAHKVAREINKIGFDFNAYYMKPDENQPLLKEMIATVKKHMVKWVVEKEGEDATK